jgi:peptide/nickel transport system permease protein
VTATATAGGSLSSGRAENPRGGGRASRRAGSLRGPAASQARAPLPGLFWVGAAMLGLLVAAAVLAPLLAPDSPTAVSGPSLAAPSLAHPLGTDGYGRDVLSEILFGARTSLVVAFGSSSLAVALGGLVGIGAALAGGATEVVAMRAVDTALALPMLPLLMLVAALAGPSLATVTLSIGLLGWPGPARVLRAQAASLRSRGYLRLARGFGASRRYLLRRHVAPALGPVAVSAFVSIAAHAVLLEAGLAFLGLANPTGASWGLLLNQALESNGLFFTDAWTWWVLPAGLAVTFAVLAFTFLGVGVEPLLRPAAAGEP